MESLYWLVVAEPWTGVLMVILGGSGLLTFCAILGSWGGR